MIRSVFDRIKSSKKAKATLIMVVFLSIVYYFILPEKLFNDSYTTVLYDRSGQLLGAAIAEDGQWRFPEIDTVPEKFAHAITAFEDKRFWNHPGVDILSIARALKQNIAAGKIVSGGSTLTMQVVRLSRDNPRRTFFEKIYEMILATRLELRFSKNQILSLYASHAPFGSNVVGLKAACWRYFYTDAKDLSWGQAALLAVLPNSPSLLHPGKNRELLKSKRDRLLDKLKANGVIDDFTCQLAKEESIPEAPQPLIRYAPHLLTRAIKENFKGKEIYSTVDVDLQQRLSEMVNAYVYKLKVNQIHNAAALILEVSTGEVLAYAGNVTIEKEHENDVDIITARRSTGSILKPFLYAAMLDDGKILPHTLLPDIPVIMKGFSPKNFSLQYDGAVKASEALVRSLNIPAVHLLSDYRYERFHGLLTNMGMSTLNNPPDHYGLSLILGGAEGTLWDITGMYASMARTLNHYFEYPGSAKYQKSDFHSPYYFTAPKAEKKFPEEASYLSAATIYQTFDAMKELSRPSEETGWKHFSSSKEIAWKTGTSFGFRDGWAVGVTKDFVVGVWVGNADGEGRPGLTGTDAAAPLMFEAFSLLPSSTWFETPLQEMTFSVVCSKSGYKISSYCTDGVDTLLISKAGLQTSVCPFHKPVHLNAERKFRVHDACYSVADMKHENWFTLPPIQEFYYKRVHPTYKSLPPMAKGCRSDVSIQVMDMVYPKANAKIFIPKELDGSLGSTVFELVHRNAKANVFWHLDGMYIGQTSRSHKIPFSLKPGHHVLTIMDENGENISLYFQAFSKL